MKKALIVLLAVALAAPAMAVNLTIAPDTTPLTVKVGYAGNGTTAATRARAFALTITADNGATITGVTAAPANANGAGYGIFPGRIQIATDGSVTSYGIPVEQDNLHNSGASAIGTGQVIIAMGSLYAQGGTAPGAEGQLVTVTVSKACKVTVTPESTYRGGVVAEDANAMTVAAVNYQFPTECLVVGRVFQKGLTVTQAMVDKWITLGKPACWCCEAQKYGNGKYASSSAGRVDTQDLGGLKAGWYKSVGETGYDACADFNLSGRIDTQDLGIMKANWYLTPGTCL